LRNQRYYERFRDLLIARQRDSKRKKKEKQAQKLNIDEDLSDSNKEQDIFSGIFVNLIQNNY